MKIYKLVNNGRKLGYRISDIPGTKVKLDISIDLAKKLFKVLDTSKLEKCSVINMKLENGFFVAPDEVDVVEVNTLEECLAFINKEAKGNGGNKKSQSGIDVGLKGNNLDFSFINDYLGYDDVNSFKKRVEFCCRGVVCSASAYLNTNKWDSTLKLDIHVPNLMEASKVLCRWYDWKSKLTVEVSGNLVEVDNSVESVADILKKMLKLPDGRFYGSLSPDVFNVSVEGVEVELSEDIMLVIYEECSVPGYYSKG